MAPMTRPTIGQAGSAAVVAGLVLLGSLRAQLLQTPPRRLDGWAFALIAIAAGALAWRRAAPRPTLAVSVAATSGYLAAGYPYGPILVCAGWALFEVARRHPLPVSSVAAAAAGIVSAAAVAPRLTGELQVLGIGLALWVGCWLAVPWSLGALLQVRAAAAEQARRDLAARAALAERVRMSREVHDVAGHGFAVIAMQAGVALLVLDEQPRQARASLEAIRAAATAALDELRGVLQQEPATESAVLGIAEVPDLVARARAAGLPVVLELAEVGSVPAEIGGIVYRVVREALTNVIRHAGPTEATVTLTRESGRLRLTVADRGAGPPGATADDAGRGLAGLRARVEAAGGTFSTGARDGGGFTVEARLPVPEDVR